MPCFHIHITGQVQGVGFRPFVYVAARSFELTGWVKNTIDGVHIRFCAPEQIADAFYRYLIDHKPAMSIITRHEMKLVGNELFEDFTIIQSDESGRASLLITPDFAMCPDCRNELRDSNNRRKGYPFITCTNCGPRFSIITSLPYDRPYTTMDGFSMCRPCQEEYNNPLDRRYYSQTNSCPDCPVSMEIYREGRPVSGLNGSDDQLDFIVESLKRGKILALKGIGGFLLICDAGNEETVKELRRRKYRPAKAFAMMFPELNTIIDEFRLSEKGRQFLQSAAAPIVLLGRVDSKNSRYAWEQIAPGLDRIGVMLPYTPLYQLILDRFGSAIVATSGNLSEAPIVYRNKEAITRLGKIADFVVINDREIVVPQDDSVVLFTEKKEQKILLRRSRGLAPGYLDERLEFPDATILAVGAEMKSSFTLLNNQIPYISQYLGDLEDFATQEAFRHTLQHMLNLFNATPGLVLHDLHPQYYSTQLANQLSGRYACRRQAIQHHEAHFAAILGEHALFSQAKPVMGIIWDGTGYGSDGMIWGGEIFRFEHGKILHESRLGYFDFLFGDKMAREPRISLLALGKEIPACTEMLEGRFTRTEWQVYQKWLGNPAVLKTSSMGRLFDAVASLLLNLDKMSYEGEAAMYLEVAARTYRRSEGLSIKWLETNVGITKQPDPVSLIRSLHLAIGKGISANALALDFHEYLVSWIGFLAENSGIRKLAFSGGVFQNSLLVDLIIDKMGSTHELFFHEKLAPNDECISFGQLMHHLHIRGIEKS